MAKIFPSNPVYICVCMCVCVCVCVGKRKTTSKNQIDLFLLKGELLQI